MFGVEYVETETTDAAFGLSADQHERRRCDGLPTVSALIGPVALGQRMWRTWAGQHNRSTAVVAGGPESDLCEKWVVTLLNHHNLYESAEHFLAPRLRKPVEAIRTYLQKKTLHELDLIFERAQLEDSGMGPGRLCRWLLLRRMFGDPLTPGELIRTQVSWVESASQCTAAVFQQLIGLLGCGSPPTLLVMPEDVGAQSPTQEGLYRQAEALHAVAESLTELAIRVPQLTVGLAVDKELWNTYVRRAHESFAKAVVRENIICIAGWTVNQMRQVTASRVVRDVRALEPVIEELAKMGASAKLVESLVAASVAPQVESVVEQKAWKSEQERFLFELLEHTADVGGLFQLNADPGFLFGKKAAEVDLACLDLRIAVEIDGHYHFTDPDHYRRDRRKDLQLQQHGYLVLRFLADDVVPEMKMILETIRAAVRFRKTHIQS